jgi:hypothetical protein
MDIDRRTLLRRVGVVGLAGLAGCTGGDGGNGDTPDGPASPAGTATPTPAPTKTPACGDTTFRDAVGEVSFEFGVKTVGDEDRYDGRLRIYHVRTPVCRFEAATATTAPGDCEEPTEELVHDEAYRVTGDTSYDIVSVPVTEDVDSYRLEWAAAGGEDRKTGTEDAARQLFDEFDYDFLVCDPGARRFGFVVADGNPRIVRAAEES